VSLIYARSVRLPVTCVKVAQGDQQREREVLRSKKAELGDGLRCEQDGLGGRIDELGGGLILFLFLSDFILRSGRSKAAHLW
jgi:hypothetical protein